MCIYPTAPSVCIIRGTMANVHCALTNQITLSTLVRLFSFSFCSPRLFCVHVYDAPLSDFTVYTGQTVLCTLDEVGLGVGGVAQVVKHSAAKVWILLHGRSILHGGSICSLGYFPVQPVVHNWTIQVYGMCCPVCGNVHMKDPLLLIRKNNLSGDSGFPLKGNISH